MEKKSTIFAFFLPLGVFSGNFFFQAIGSLLAGLITRFRRATKIYKSHWVAELSKMKKLIEEAIDYYYFNHNHLKNNLRSVLVLFPTLVFDLFKSSSKHWTSRLRWICQWKELSKCFWFLTSQESFSMMRNLPNRLVFFKEETVLRTFWINCPLFATYLPLHCRIKQRLSEQMNL